MNGIGYLLYCLLIYYMDFYNKKSVFRLTLFISVINIIPNGSIIKPVIIGFRDQCESRISLISKGYNHFI
jgi:hypothetical protein